MAEERRANDKRTDEVYQGIKHNKEEMEFGGPIGVAALMIWSHYILFYFWYCSEKAQGQMILPDLNSNFFGSLAHHCSEFGSLVMEKGIPSPTTWIAYFLFFFVQLVLAAIMPGLTMYGLPTSPDGKRLPYHCNGYLCYYVCIWGFLFANYMNWFEATHMATHFGEYLMAAVIIGDVTSVYWYWYGLVTTDPLNGKSPSSGSIIYDIFMGTVLYPRIGEVDIKMIAEVRWSWLTLMVLTMSCAFQQYHLHGFVSKEMCFMLYAHWLYSNATVKGEHCIPCTWDMFHERFGWMLNFWNIAAFIFALVTLAYYIFDSANSQKASCKLPEPIIRNTFPAVPWAILKNPKFIKTPKGDLLVDGWYAFARKMQYTGDIFMALSWGLICGFSSPLPYFYCCFFTCMINHRQGRDEVRCSEKYGEYWAKYTRTVPNVFFPGSSFVRWLLTGEMPHVE